MKKLTFEGVVSTYQASQSWTQEACVPTREYHSSVVWATLSLNARKESSTWMTIKQTLSVCKFSILRYFQFSILLTRRSNKFIVVLESQQRFRQGSENIIAYTIATGLATCQYNSALVFARYNVKLSPSPEVVFQSTSDGFDLPIFRVTKVHLVCFSAIWKTNKCQWSSSSYFTYWTLHD